MTEHTHLGDRTLFNSRGTHALCESQSPWVSNIFKQSGIFLTFIFIISKLIIVFVLSFKGFQTTNKIERRNSNAVAAATVTQPHPRTPNHNHNHNHDPPIPISPHLTWILNWERFIQTIYNVAMRFFMISY